MLGSFVSAGFFGTLGLTATTGVPGLVAGLLLTLLVSMFALGTLNVMIERVAYRPLRDAPKLAPLITAVGFSFILQNVGLLWRGQPDAAPDLIGSQKDYFTIFGVAIEHSDVFAVVVTAPLLIALVWFVGSTRYGKAMRATAQDPDAARLMGINVDRTISLTFLLGGLLAGAAGMIYALYNGTIQFNQGFTAGLIAFTAAVMGGIGNLKGAVVGGLIIGVIQSISDTHFGQVWTPAVVFAILILIMVFKPQGLFGEETREG
jgi:branched-chain amino acid transport system permease protein